MRKINQINKAELKSEITRIVSRLVRYDYVTSSRQVGTALRKFGIDPVFYRDLFSEVKEELHIVNCNRYGETGYQIGKTQVHLTIQISGDY